jgi:hypothetical protein
MRLEAQPFAPEFPVAQAQAPAGELLGQILQQWGKNRWGQTLNYNLIWDWDRTTLGWRRRRSRLPRGENRRKRGREMRLCRTPLRSRS